MTGIDNHAALIGLQREVDTKFVSEDEKKLKEQACFVQHQQAAEKGVVRFDPVFSIARSYVQNNMQDLAQPVELYYLENFLNAISYYAKAAEISYDHNLIMMSKVSLGWSYLKLEKYTLSEEK